MMLCVAQTGTWREVIEDWLAYLPVAALKKVTSSVILKVYYNSSIWKPRVLKETLQKSHFKVSKKRMWGEEYSFLSCGMKGTSVVVAVKKNHPYLVG